MTLPVRVLLAGEGPSELGSRAGHPAYQSATSPGVLERLLLRTRADGWEVGSVRTWKSVRSLRVGKGANDQKRVLALANDAIESNCTVLAFTRDQDTDTHRVAVIRAGVEQARAEFSVTIVGQVAVPVLEAWILALNGVKRTESLSPTAAKAKLRELAVTSASQMADVAENADLASVPTDARGLREWLEEARLALTSE